MRTNHFSVVRAPHDRAHHAIRGELLGEFGEVVNSGPDVDFFVGGAAAGSEGMGFPGAPGEGFDGGVVFVELHEQAGGFAQLPDAHGVVVGTRSEVGVLEG